MRPIVLVLLLAGSLSACLAPPAEPALIAMADGTCVLMNLGEEPITYRGYAPDSPIYSLEIQIDGQWQASRLGWCGTGLAEQRLEPGARITFTAGTGLAPAQDAHACRVLIDISCAGHARRLVSNDRPSAPLSSGPKRCE